MPLNRPYRTRCRYDYPSNGLTSRHGTDSQAHSSIGTPPPPPPRTRGGTGSDGSQAPGFRYSFTPLPGYFSPFPHGTHPLSVTRTYSGSQVVLADSHRIPRAPCYNGHAPTPTPTRFRLRGYHPLRHAIPDASATRPRKRPAPAETGNKHAPQPRRRNPRRVSHDNGLAIIRFRSPLLTEYLLLRVLRCFTSPRHPSRPTQPQTRVTPHNECQVSPFGHPRITARQPAPRGLSQATTSFIGP